MNIPPSVAGKPSEIEALAKLVGENPAGKPRTFVEIGSWEGGSLWYLSRACLEEGLVISIDADTTRPFPSEIVQTGQIFVRLEGNSHNPDIHKKAKDLIFGIWPSGMGSGIDLLFIDGDHSYKGVKADYEMYAPLVNAGGIIAFHDIFTESIKTGVGRFWEELKQSHSRFMEIDGAETNIERLGIGVLYV